MENLTRLAETAFSEQIGSWCNERGVLYAGHVIEDNNQHTRTGSGMGHFFRGEAGQDMAGIDCIGGQVLPQGEWTAPYGITQEVRNGHFYHYVLGKLAVSLASVDVKKQGRSVCEIFGNYGWEEGVRLEKYLIDHFLVQGINHFVPHAFSPAAFPDPDCPPHFYAHGNNPQYRHFGALMGYANRVCSLINGGKRIVKAAVLYHAECEWLGKYTSPESIAQTLCEQQIDFDFIPADVFTDEKKYGTAFENGLSVNGNNYAALLIPKAQYIPKAVEDACTKLNRTECKVFFVGGVPAASYDGEKIAPFMAEATEIATDATADKLQEIGVADIIVSPRSARIRVLRYLGETPLYMIVNESKEDYCGKITVPNSGECYAYNAWENRVEKVNAQPEKMGTALTVTLAPLKSLIVVFDKADIGLYEEKPYERTALSDGWLLSKCRSIDYPAFADAVAVSLPDNAQNVYPGFSGFLRYEKEIDGNVFDGIEITDAYEGVEVFVNGKSLGIQIAPPFRYEIKKHLLPGKNILRIEVATTLERELAGLPDPTRTFMGLAPKVPTSRSGIGGNVYLLKEKK